MPNTTPIERVIPMHIKPRLRQEISWLLRVRHRVTVVAELDKITFEELWLTFYEQQSARMLRDFLLLAKQAGARKLRDRSIDELARMDLRQYLANPHKDTCKEAEPDVMAELDERGITSVAMLTAIRRHKLVLVAELEEPIVASIASQLSRWQLDLAS